MNQRLQTIILVVIAAVLSAAAYFTGPTAPTLDEFDDQGQPFYPDFTDPLLAASLEVIEFDETSGAARPFKVEVKDGTWSIPSHHDYPADGEKRLAETAAALIDLKRDVIQSDRPQDHENLGVIGPLDETSAAIQGRGSRVTLRSESGAVLADYIFGREIESKPGFRYVRLPDKKRTYAVDVNIDVSTRFADWIETNLLDVQGPDITELEINDYTIEETTLTVEQVGTVTLAKGADNAWAMKDGVPEGRELDTTKVSAMTNALRNLTITGVRPKPASLTADLREAEGLQIDMGTQLSLQSKGFFVTRDGRLLSNEGEVELGTKQGVRYTLRFGEVLYGEGMSVSAGADEGEAGGAADDPAAKENRYLFLTARFDEGLVGAKPVMPEGYDADADADPDPDADPAAEAARRVAVEAYERELAEWETRVEQGKARAKELNDRFASWYYVISGSDFQDIRLNLETVTKPVTKPAAPAAG